MKASVFVPTNQGATEKGLELFKVSVRQGIRYLVHIYWVLMVHWAPGSILSTEISFYPYPRCYYYLLLCRNGGSESLSNLLKTTQQDIELSGSRAHPFNPCHYDPPYTQSSSSHTSCLLIDSAPDSSAVG